MSGYYSDGRGRGQQKRDNSSAQRGSYSSGNGRRNTYYEEDRYAQSAFRGRYSTSGRGGNNRRKKKKNNFLPMLLLVVLLAVGVFAGVKYFQNRKAEEEQQAQIKLEQEQQAAAEQQRQQEDAVLGSDTIYEGVSINGIALGGMTRQQATEAVEQSLGLAEHSLTLQYNDQTFQVPLMTGSDLASVIDQAYQVGRDGTREENLAKIEEIKTQPVEFTVEAGRPDCTDEEKLRIIKEYGATRISINPQTFSDEVLRNIGRRHTAQDILDCYRTARRVGHDNINMDLIAGLPGDTVEGFRHSLQTAIDLDPENITVHTLTLKRASNLVVEHRAADYADVAAMVESCELLEKAGYRPYYLYRQKGTLQNLENVGWCKPGYECLYNIYIMEEVHTILSAGAGGSTKLVAPGARHGKIERIFNYKYPTEYIDRFDTILARKEGVKQFYDQYPSCGESARPQAHGGV